MSQITGTTVCPIGLNLQKNNVQLMKETLTGEVTFLNCRDRWEILIINSRNG